MGLIRLGFAVVLVWLLASIAASLFGGIAAAGLAVLGAMVFLPVLIFKGLFLLMIFGFFARRAFARSGGPRPVWRNRPDQAESSAQDRFDEWHRMAHARAEVDSWTPEVDPSKL